MGKSLSANGFELFRTYIEQQCGMTLGAEKAYLIESRLSKMLADSSFTTFEELYHSIYNSKDRSMVEKMIDAITTNETLWFRDKSPWIVLEEVLLPHYLTRLRQGKGHPVRIWSAACSTGQEPYSTAMCIDNYLQRNGITDVSLKDFEIIATDISQSVLTLAKKGRYDSISIMRGLPEEYKQKYFDNQGRIWEIDPKIRKAVKFKRFNLQDSFISLGSFDIIFCRYVMIYFSQVFRKTVFRKISQSLVDNGVMFLGNAEVFFNEEKLYHPMEHKGAIYYRVKGEK